MSKQTKKGAKQYILKPETFDIDKLEFDKPDMDSKRGSKTQLVLYPRYEFAPSVKKNLTFKTDWVEMNQGGIPKLSEEYHKNGDDDRTYMRFPFDPEQVSCVNVKNMFNEIDKKVGNMHYELFADIFTKKDAERQLKKKLTMKQYKEYLRQTMQYSPLVKSQNKEAPQLDLGEPDDDDQEDVESEEENIEDEEEDQDDGKPVKEYFDTAKMRFSRKWDEKKKKPTVIDTVVFIRDPENNTLEQQPCYKDVSALEKDLNYMCKQRMGAMINKMWIQKAADDKGIRKYGLTVKILQLEIIPGTGGGQSIKKEFAEYLLGDDDEEEKPTTSVESEESLHEEDEEENEENEENEEEEEDEEVEEEEEEEEIEEEEEEVKPPPKPTSKGKTNKKKT